MLVYQRVNHVLQGGSLHIFLVGHGAIPNFGRPTRQRYVDQHGLDRMVTKLMNGHWARKNLESSDCWSVLICFISIVDDN